MPQCHCVVSAIVSSLDSVMQMLVVPFHGSLINAAGTGRNHEISVVPSDII